MFVLDFLNDTETITKAFSDSYWTMVLSDETDPDRLHALQADLDGAQVYTPDQVRTFVKLYLDCAERRRLDPILDRFGGIEWGDRDPDQPDGHGGHPGHGGEGHQVRAGPVAARPQPAEGTRGAESLCC